MDFWMSDNEQLLTRCIRGGGQETFRGELRSHFWNTDADALRHKRVLPVAFECKI
jgi:hypothetical protein